MSNWPAAQLSSRAADRPVAVRLAGIGHGGEVADRRVRTVANVVIRPRGQLFAGMPEVEEKALVQQLVAHPAVEGFHEPVLRRLVRRDVVPRLPRTLLVEIDCR